MKDCEGSSFDRMVYGGNVGELVWHHYICFEMMYDLSWSSEVASAGRECGDDSLIVAAIEAEPSAQRHLSFYNTAILTLR